ncbi:UspA domain protein [Haladaptatus paucihalophilus DX253]|uniref:Universal stress protein family protein n=1 Tax=Haladaptatus paucihalophilus DX253 TaxID=797209 RepID=E7QNH8_HALPU|nr:HPP family protein [Haladaptatus paucihalophilus]EFW94048.1 UspA domain protein [Haladaptatus paucihalophilus DX253]SHK63385.1 Universal stress protein family protein [Haladaptatus paucihalophilus DX253]
MRNWLRTMYERSLARARRVRRRETKEFRRWLETSANLRHLTALIALPLLIAGITALSDRIEELSFLLYPPLASGTYTLFSDPDGRYASPRNFVGGLGTGAVCGWFSVLFSEAFLNVPEIQPLQAHPVTAALAVFLTIAATWALSLELPAAFSTSLLAVVVGVHDPYYVASVIVSSVIVISVFGAWRREFYQKRSRYLYQSTNGDDHVLVPMRGQYAEGAAMFGAKLASAHDAGKVVLVDIVDDTAIENAKGDDGDGTDPTLVARENAELDADGVAETQAADEAAARLERQAQRIRTRVGVPCEVVIAGDGSKQSRTILRTARETNCDLIVTPYEEKHGSLSPFVRKLFRGRIDAIVYRPAPDTDSADARRYGWKRILVPVRRAGDTAHAMIDFAQRLVGRTGTVSVCTCIDRESERRRAESTLADLVEAFEGSFETRISRDHIEQFLTANDDHYDLIFIGASTNRSAASRFISPPTFERLHEVECDVAVVHRG